MVRTARLPIGMKTQEEPKRHSELVGSLFCMRATDRGSEGNSGLPVLPDIPEVLGISRKAGYEMPPPVAQRIIELAQERALVETGWSDLDSDSDEGRALLVGALSILLETIRSAEGDKKHAADAAISLARRVLELNPARHAKMNEESSVPFDEAALRRFAEIISLNDYNWSDFSISFVSPEEARKDRLRRNLQLTPTERLIRHQNLMRQLIAARNSRSGGTKPSSGPGPIG